ncbi:MAG: outer membrane protein assembly factor BamA [Sphaerochaetaceae bacterium]|jgi:outer membrane protein insertion porin family|nr:outer membrane protein assembly factor BamA [Sphaerochaetaceae bacterium]MDY0371747.1 outer membrane protein assembly factor BamA [Sphaerochaetaceae bacterium]
MLRKMILSILLSVAIFSVAAVEPPALDAWWVNKPMQEFVYVDLNNVDSATIDPYVQPLVGVPYTQPAIEALRSDLLNTGLFLEVEIIPARIDGSTDASIIYIEFVERQKLTSINFVGNKFVTTEDLAKAINLQTGTMFDTAALDKAIVAIKKLYASKGYDKVDVFSSYVADEQAEGIALTISITEYDWYLNKPIRGFTYKGLKNVSVELLDDITYPFIGKPFTQETYRQIESKLNELLKFSVFQAEAKRSGPNNNELTIEFIFTELPVIRTIDFVGNDSIKAKVLLDKISVKPKEFLSLNRVNAGKEALEALYLERGYANVQITSNYTIEETTNLLDLTYTITEGKQVKVGEISFEGNEAIAASVLKKDFTTKVQSLFNSGNYQATKVASDTQALQLVYQKLGYIDAKVLEVRQEEISDDADIRKIRLVFVVEEGQQWFFGGIKVEGNTVYSDSDISALLVMKPGSVLDISKVQREIGKIADLYWNEGYVENTIDIQESRNLEDRSVTYTVLITERGQATIEEVLIRGLTKTKPYVLERELALQVGDIFSKDAYIRSAQNLYNTGLLTDVVPSLNYGTTENSLVVAYDVTEGNQMNIGFGATFGGNVEGFPVSGFLSWADTNVGGTGRDLEIMTELSPDSQSATVSFRDTWVKDKRWGNSVNLSFNHSRYKNGRVLGDGSPTTELRDNEAYPYPYTSYAQWVSDGSPTPDAEYLMPYDSYKIGIGFTTGYTFVFAPGRLSLSVGPTFTLNRAVFDSDTYTAFDYLIDKYEKNWQFSNRVALSVSWDGRDLVTNTTKGYVISQNLTYAGGVLGGLSNYMRSSTSASGFLKLFEIPGEKPTPGVLSLNTTVSFMFNQYYSKSGNLSGEWTSGISASKFEFLYIDGMTIARGITPKFYYEFLWDSSLEFSIQIAENVLWGDVFVSATGASNALSTVGIDPLDWYFAAGLGIRLKIPGFPLGLYLVKNAKKVGSNAFAWEGGPIFKSGADGSGLKLVLAITTSIY